MATTTGVGVGVGVGVGLGVGTGVGSGVGVDTTGGGSGLLQADNMVSSAKAPSKGRRLRRAETHAAIDTRFPGSRGVEFVIGRWS